MLGVMLIRIDPQATEPIYAQLVREVRRAVAAGEVGVGDRLPAARELARSLDINMHTVLRAYAELRDEGVIELRRGRGAVVLEAPRQPEEVSAALRELVALARHHDIPLTDLHRALDDEGGTP